MCSLTFSAFKIGYWSSHSFEVILNPAFSKPSSHVVKNLDSTSPEPKPPFIVFLAPEPINNTLQGLDIGNWSFLFKNIVHSEAAFCKNSISFKIVFFEELIKYMIIIILNT